MARTSATLVKKIVKVKTSHDLTPFIEASNQLVTDCCTGFGYSDDKLERIERWLAAHFYCIQYSRRLQEQVSGAQITNQSKVDLYLNLTHYGQMAQVLDTEGGLTRLQDQLETQLFVKARIIWLGRNDD